MVWEGARCKPALYPIREYEMTKEELIAKLKELGLDVNGATEEVIQKAQAWLEDQKAQLDTETRRKVRAFWIGVTAVGIVLGIAAGWFGRSMIG
nr:hypothetical protein [Sutterella wadsworthensis]